MKAEWRPLHSLKSSLREIFADAAEIVDPAGRTLFLDRACQDDRALRERVERLLAADTQAGNFLRSSGDTTTRALISEKPGDLIGRYRLIESIGRGGGGVVYLAEQEEPVRRRVALKVLKLGMDTQSVVARFGAERQALAMMEHPNIAKVLDVGATETGRPFFVMELVSGLRLDDYCNLRDLSLPERLELFIPVCHAVQHAHQKGIVHRDLKPSNILVTEHEGVALPKVIDFGIAKATEQELGEHGLTSADQFLGTPAYMSPEQVEYGGRDIDTRSSVSVQWI
jgi:eukaryotic-like serine/threonine-protein kinase